MLVVCFVTWVLVRETVTLIRHPLLSTPQSEEAVFSAIAKLGGGGTEGTPESLDSLIVITSADQQVRA